MSRYCSCFAASSPAAAAALALTVAVAAAGQAAREAQHLLADTASMPQLIAGLAGAIISTHVSNGGRTPIYRPFTKSKGSTAVWKLPGVPDPNPVCHNTQPQFGRCENGWFCVGGVEGWVLRQALPHRGVLCRTPLSMRSDARPPPPLPTPPPSTTHTPPPPPRSCLIDPSGHHWG